MHVSETGVIERRADMNIQWITELLALIAATAAIFAAVGWALWFVIGLRVAPVQQDVSKLKVAVSDLDSKVSDLNAKFSELNGKFDMIMTLFGKNLDIDSLPKTDSSEDPTSGSSAPAQ